MTIQSSGEVGGRAKSVGNAYRSFLHLEPMDDPIAAVLQQASSWMREKGLEPELERSGFARQDDSEVLVIHHEDRDGRNLRLRLLERTPIGEWRTELTVHQPSRGSGWLGLDVNNSEDRFVKVPRLAGYLLKVLPLRDGGVELTPEPTVTNEHGVDEVIDALCDPERQGLVLISGTDDQLDFDSFRKQVTLWTRQVVGLAQVFVLSPSATSAFASKIMSPSHAAPPWTVRTYLGLVDPAVVTDARRHRILGTNRLARQSDASIQAILGRTARTYSTDRVMSAEMGRVNRLLARLEDRLLIEGLTSAESPTATLVQPVDVAPTAVPQSHDLVNDLAAYLAQVELVRRVLGVKELTETSLSAIVETSRRGRLEADAVDRVTRQLLERQQHIDEVEHELAYYKDMYEREEFERALIEEEHAKLDDTVRWLRKRLADSRDFEAAYGAVPAEAFTGYPRSFDDLLTRMPELEERGVFFTGDKDAVRELDDYDSLDKLVRASWDVLLVLTDYVRARSDGHCDQGVDHYLAHTPQGYRQLPPKRHAALETRATMNGWGDERVFPVPAEVSQKGYVVMGAHFKIGRVGRVSPRLHYIDCWTKTSRVYVGYIGAHLTNTQS
jgi:hypothetical protein